MSNTPPPVHFLFGEQRQSNESRVVPKTTGPLKDWLTSWLPKWVLSVEEAAPDFGQCRELFGQCRELCRNWQTGDHRDEVGVISLPLPEGVERKGATYTRLICRVYPNWASGGRPSRSAHAVLLTEEQWEGLGYNPFKLPHLVQNAKAFETWNLDFDTWAQEFADATQNPDLTPGANASTLPLRLKADAPPAAYERALMRLSPEVRAGVSCACGVITLKRERQRKLDLAAQDPGVPCPTARTDLQIPPLNAEPEQRPRPEPYQDARTPVTRRQPEPTPEVGAFARVAQGAGGAIGGLIIGTIAGIMAFHDGSGTGMLGLVMGAFAPSVWRMGCTVLRNSQANRTSSVDDRLGLD
jgi:hypothetical protein